MAKSSASHVDVTIRIDKADADRLDDIVRALEASGLASVDVHRRFLIVNGSIPGGGVEALRKVSGVASVREDRRYKTQGPS